MKNTRAFTHNDQLKFAELTGDFNPIHVDALAARRTQAGAQVVHGIHALLWLLNYIGESHPDLPDIKAIKVRFIRMIYIEEQIEAVISEQDTDSLRASIMVDGVATLSVNLIFGEPQAAPSLPQYEIIKIPENPIDQSFENMDDLSSIIDYKAKKDSIAQEFPHATHLLGAQRVVALACSSLIVGMIVPGLHSLYAGLSLSFHETNNDEDKIAFNVKKVDERFRLIKLEMFTNGLSGSLETFVRHPPTQQTSMKSIDSSANEKEFEHIEALIIGGSRGLGELTAKIIAAGGGSVTITYNMGEESAQRVANEINSFGGRCQIIHYNALQNAAEQIPESVKPTDLYYFATSGIFRGKPGAFSQKLFNEFNTFYVQGFKNIVETCLIRTSNNFRVFYPSSVAIDEEPEGMQEYIKSKLAGEKLCNDIQKQNSNISILVSRLPRLPTDQTATIQYAKTADPLETLLPIVRSMSSLK